MARKPTKRTVSPDPEAIQPQKRTVSPDGEAIKRLRLEKGWRVEDLATKAICSVKTVENVERGANVYVFTLAKLAKGLGVEFMTLVQGHKPPPEPPRPQPHIQMQFVLSIPFDQFDESAQLGGFIEFLKQFMKGGGNINVVGVAPGSTIITVEVSVDDMLALSSALSEGKLAEMLCDELRLKFKPEPIILDSDVLDSDAFGPAIGRISERPSVIASVSEDVTIEGEGTPPETAPQRQKGKKHKATTGPQGKKGKKHKPETKP
jgi:transcriptional regulator with XRE-family HTH domain